MPLPGGSAFRGRPAGLSSGGAQTCALLTEGEGLARRDEQVGDRQGRPEACQARAFGQWDGCQRQRAVAVAGRGHHEARRRTLQRGQAEAQDRLQASLRIATAVSVSRAVTAYDGRSQPPCSPPRQR